MLSSKDSGNECTKRAFAILLECTHSRFRTLSFYSSSEIVTLASNHETRYNTLSSNYMYQAQPSLQRKDRGYKALSDKIPRVHIKFSRNPSLSLIEALPDAGKARYGLKHGPPGFPLVPRDLSRFPVNEIPGAITPSDRNVSIRDLIHSTYDTVFDKVRSLQTDAANLGIGYENYRSYEQKRKAEILVQSRTYSNDLDEHEEDLHWLVPHIYPPLGGYKPRDALIVEKERHRLFNLRQTRVDEIFLFYSFKVGPDTFLERVPRAYRRDCFTEYFHKEIHLQDIYETYKIKENLDLLVDETKVPANPDDEAVRFNIRSAHQSAYFLKWGTRLLFANQYLLIASEALNGLRSEIQRFSHDRKLLGIDAVITNLQLQRIEYEREHLVRVAARVAQRKISKKRKRDESQQVIEIIDEDLDGID